MRGPPYVIDFVNTASAWSGFIGSCPNQWDRLGAVTPPCDTTFCTDYGPLGLFGLSQVQASLNAVICTTLLTMYKKIWFEAAGLHTTFSHPSFALLAFFFTNSTMIPSFALLGGITLFSSAVAAVTHQVNVSNNTAALIFDPSYIVRKPTIVFDRCADIPPSSDCRGGGHCRVYLPSQEPQCDSVKLC